MIVIDVTDYGALGTGGDDTAAIEAACAAAKPGNTILFKSGRFGITRTIHPPCRIMGVDHTSVLFALPGSGDNAKPLIDIAGKSNIGVLDMCLEGSGEFVASVSHVGAISFGSGATAVEGVRIERNLFRNHHSEYWVLASADLDVKGTIFAYNTFETKPGDMTTYVPANENGGQLLTFFGSTTGMFVDSKILHNTVYGTGVPIGFGFFGSHRKLDCSHNQFTDMGKSSLPIHNSYAIVVYALGKNDAEALLNYPGYAVITGNNIYGCESAGIYTASARNLLISNNYVSGQRRTDDQTLPRGGIVVNGGNDQHVYGNTLQDCWCGISKGGWYEKGVYIHGNRIWSNVAYAIGMRLEGLSQPDARISVRNNDIMLWSGVSTAYKNQLSGTGDIIIRDNCSKAMTHGLVDVSSPANKSIANNLFFHY